MGCLFCIMFWLIKDEMSTYHYKEEKSEVNRESVKIGQQMLSLNKNSIDTKSSETPRKHKDILRSSTQIFLTSFNI